jgi:hypothetical protein
METNAEFQMLRQEALERTPPSASTVSPDGKACTLEFARNEDAKLIEFSAMRTSIIGSQYDCDQYATRFGGATAA